MKTTRRKKLPRRGDRGSALLVSLMVIVGLSLLGLGFVALSETEATIAKNEQQALQTQAIAEAGVKLAVEWFQDPVWATQTAGCPKNDPGLNANLSAIKLTRFTGTSGSGVYKPNSTSLLFDKPYRPDPGNRFYGAEQNPDIRINGDNDRASIDAINTFLMGSGTNDRDAGEIYEVAFYAPPMVGATLTPDGNTPPNYFWLGGQRYGVATIKVTAVQLRDPGKTGTNRYLASNIKARHSVKVVVGEIPLPIPGGPIQSNANISFGGDFVVHWGMETATGSLTNKRNPSSLPWANAYERPHFEHGYEPGTSIAQIIVTAGGSGYTAPPVVTIAAPAAGGTTAQATAVVTNGVVTAINVDPNIPGSGYVAAPPNWAPTVTLTPVAGGTGASAQAVIGHEAWPVVNGSNFDNAYYMQEMLGKTFEDPWFGSRSQGDNMADGATPTGVKPMCYPYSYSSVETSANNAPYSFQWQSTNTYPWIKKVIFPTIRYDFWKRITQSGKGYKGIYYFSYAGAAQGGGGKFYKFGSGAANTMYYWANSVAGGANMGPGVYFFDTTDGNNPQNAPNPTNLTPAESWNSQNFNGSFLMAGFVYMNATSFGTQGNGNGQTTIDATFPGEPYRDIGYPEWDPTASAWTIVGGQIKRDGAGDGVFSYQDLNNNGRFDVVVMPAPAWQSYDPLATAHGAGTTYVVKTWKSNAQATHDYGQPCTIPAATYNGTNAAPSDCSEPHEPYLNMIYPSAATGSITIGWQAPGTIGMKKVPGATCTATSAQSVCTSNAYDEDGANVPLDVILDGILYNQGDYDSQGNAAYYGSVLIQGQVGGTGTPDVWFDEKLIKGTWAPPRMPRVIVFSEQTDELGQ